jgi:lipopolysaccharide export system protein LptA
MSRRRATGLASAALGSALILAIAAASQLQAQTLNNTFGGLSESSDEPIDIESDVLTVYDAKKFATFKGNVKAVQGTTTLRAAELDVHYVGGAEKLTGQGGQPVPVANPAAPASGQKKAGGDSTQAQINKIEARGDVVITSEDDQTTTSDWALYDVPSQLVTVGGNVVLTQGQNVLKGDRLVIDLKTGESRFENTGNAAAGGRIRALFMPKRGGAADAAEPAGDSAQEPASAEGSGEPAPAPAEGAKPPAEDESSSGSEPWPIVPEFR